MGLCTSLASSGSSSSIHHDFPPLTNGTAFLEQQQLVGLRVLVPICHLATLLAQQ